MKLIFRASSVGKIMTEAQSIDPALRSPQVQALIQAKKRTPEEQSLLDELKQQSLSVGAKTYIRLLAAQSIFGVDFMGPETKPMAKGKRVEQECIELLNRVRGYHIAKNTERKSDGTFSGEADTLNFAALRGHDIKASWSIATFALLPIDCVDADYEWQMRTYMRLWCLPLWEVNYVLVDTPEDLIGFEDPALHRVGHIPERFRLTTWTVHRDLDIEARMDIKAEAARKYHQWVLEEFDRTHAIDLVPEEARSEPPAVQAELIREAMAPPRDLPTPPSPPSPPREREDDATTVVSNPF